MNGRYFLDTNIFVYSFDRDSPDKAGRAVELIHHAVTAGTGVVSFQVVHEFFNVALRRFAQPMTAAEAQQYLSTVFRPLLAVHSSVSLYSESLRMHAAYSLSWYDALIVAAAIESECSVLYTEDLQAGLRIGPLTVKDPFR